MLILLHRIFKKSKGIYHQCRYVYNNTLYRDCYDDQLKDSFYKKAKYHKDKMK